MTTNENTGTWSIKIDNYKGTETVAKGLSADRAWDLAQIVRRTAAFTYETLYIEDADLSFTIVGNGHKVAK